jgi:uncharacterized protein DUF3313
MPLRAVLFPLVALIATSACASAPSPPASFDPNGDVSIDGLVRMQNTAFAYVGAKPDFDLSPYTSFMIEPVIVRYQKDPAGVRSNAMDRNFELTPAQMRSMKELFQDEVEQALTADRGYDIVSEPGPHVARLTLYLIDLIVSVPTEQEAGRTRQFVDSYGQVTGLVEIRDSESGEILLRAGQREDPTRGTYQTVYVNPAIVRSDLTDLFRRWATMMREGLDEIRTIQASN